jgi:hypothetical protein
MIDWIVFALLLSAVAGGAFYAGWRSARAYLNAAQAIAEQTKALADLANTYNRTLEADEREVAQFRKAMNENTVLIVDKLGELEAATMSMVRGWERAGVTRPARATPGRQVGEAGPEPGDLR